MEGNGIPRILPFDGPDSFTTLVRRYAGDIPAGAMRTELCRRGTARELEEGRLAVLERWFRPAHFDEALFIALLFPCTTWRQRSSTTQNC